MVSKHFDAGDGILEVVFGCGEGRATDAPGVAPLRPSGARCDAPSAVVEQRDAVGGPSDRQLGVGVARDVRPAELQAGGARCCFEPVQRCQSFEGPLQHRLAARHQGLEDEAFRLGIGVARRAHCGADVRPGDAREDASTPRHIVAIAGSKRRVGDVRFPSARIERLGHEVTHTAKPGWMALVVRKLGDAQAEQRPGHHRKVDEVAVPGLRSSIDPSQPAQRLPEIDQVVSDEVSTGVLRIFDPGIEGVRRVEVDMVQPRREDIQTAEHPPSLVRDEVVRIVLADPSRRKAAQRGSGHELADQGSQAAVGGAGCALEHGLEAVALELALSESAFLDGIRRELDVSRFEEDDVVVRYVIARCPQQAVGHDVARGLDLGRVPRVELQ